MRISDWSSDVCSSDLLHDLSGTAVHLLSDGGELARNVSSVTVQHWGVSVGDLARVVHDDDLSQERSAALWGVVLGVTSDVSTAELLDGDGLDVETNVVSRDSLNESLVVHLDGLDFSGQAAWSEGPNQTWLEDTR